METVERKRHTPIIQPILSVLLALTALAAGVFLLRTPEHTVTIEVAGQSVTVHTRGRRVHDVLARQHIPLRGEDRVLPSPDAQIRENMRIRIERSRPVIVDVGGRRWLIYTRSTRVEDVLKDAQVLQDPNTIIRLNGHPATPDTPLPPPTWHAPEPNAPPWQWWTLPVLLEVKRPVPVFVNDNGATYTVRTTAPTIGAALHEAGVTVYLGDEVHPSLGEPVSAYMRVVILRSTPIIIEADGQRIQTRTRAHTVADALAEQGIFLDGLDEVHPPLSTPLRDNLRIRVTRIQEFVHIEDERLPYETVYVPDDDLEIDHRRVVTPGRPGIFRRRYRVRMVDGVEAARTLEDAWVAQEPITNVIAYGRKIVTRTLETPEGPITYWRRIRMLATSYSASTAGVRPDAPWFGFTRLGLKMRRGIVAVDPRVIPLGSHVYVPGYGKGFAADTGSRILGRRIDLGYDDENLVLWKQWVDVYLLTPPPPKDKINYLLPNWPRPPR